MKFILRGNRIMLDKPEKKVEEGKLDLILTDEMEKDAEKDMMKRMDSSKCLCCRV